MTTMPPNAINTTGETVDSGGTAVFDIVDYTAEHGADFKRLNVEWLERYFYVEDIDHKVLSDPQTHILDGGGRIFVARLDGVVIGTCALIRVDARRFELSKMAVSGRHQGVGAGRRLLQHALAAFRASGVALLYLESNSLLVPAITLYESVGFVHAPPTPDLGHYQRANVYMEWRP
jgi:GNAT superfamily N-acetyltransferase